MKKITISEAVKKIGENLLLSGEYIDNITKGINKDGIGQDISVKEWIKNQGGFYKVIFYLPIALTAFVLLYRITENVFPNIIIAPKIFSVKLFIYTIETLFIFCILMFISFPKTDNNNIIYTENKILRRASKSIQTFFRYWSILWVAWLILYILLTINGYIFLFKPEIAQAHFEKSFWFLALLDATNNCSSAVFFSMYFELVRFTQEEDKIRKTSPLMGSLLIVLIILISESILLSVNVNLHYYFQIGSGLAAGVTMGLFITRLGSVLLYLPTPVISYLILYAVMQIGYIFFGHGNAEELSIAFILIAFLGKTLLFIIIHYLYDTKRLLYYIYRMYYLLDEELNANYRQVFLKIYEKINSGAM